MIRQEACLGGEIFNMMLSNKVLDTLWRGLPIPSDLIVLYQAKDGFFPTSYTSLRNNQRVRRSTNLYNCWTNMKQRCLEGSDQQEKIKSYKGCINKFDNYQDFAEFCYNLPNFTKLDEFGKTYEIDKDIKGFLTQQVGTYGKDTLCMIPKDINCFLTCIQLHGDNLERSTKGVIQQHGSTFSVRTQDVCGDRQRKVFYKCKSYDEAYDYLCKLKRTQANFLADKFKDDVEDCVIKFLREFDLNVWEGWTYSKWKNKR